LVAVVDAQGGVGGFDVEGASGVEEADVHALAGDGQRAAVADASLDAGWFGCGLGWRSGRAGVARSGLLGWPYPGSHPAVANLDRCRSRSCTRPTR
jgi:hypothetical protein